MLGATPTTTAGNTEQINKASETFKGSLPHKEFKGKSLKVSLIWYKFQFNSLTGHERPINTCHVLPLSDVLT